MGPQSLPLYSAAVYKFSWLFDSHRGLLAHQCVIADKKLKSVKSKQNCNDFELIQSSPTTQVQNK